MYYLKDFWFKLRLFSHRSNWDLNGVKTNNIIRYSKFYKFPNNNLSYYVTSGADPDDWETEMTALGRILIPIYFFFASFCVLYMFFFIINFEFMTFIYLLQLFFF